MDYILSSGERGGRRGGRNSPGGISVSVILGAVAWRRRGEGYGGKEGVGGKKGGEGVGGGVGGVGRGDEKVTKGEVEA